MVTAMAMATACTTISIRMTEITGTPDKGAQAGPRSVLLGAVITAGLFVLLLAVSAFAYWQANSADRLAYPAALELAVSDGPVVAVPDGLHAKLVNLLAAEPLDQSSLNLLYAIEMRNGATAKRQAALLRSLGALGWRSTSAQRSLIIDALNKDEFDPAILRIDALLRRDQLREQIIPVLRQLEQDPSVVDALVERLRRDPNWRTLYFSSADHLADADARAARLALFSSMIAGGVPPRRSELKVSLDAFVAAGDYGPAMAFVSHLTPARSENTLNFDPDFQHAAKLSAEEQPMPLPSEWEIGRHSGAMATLAAVKQRSTLAIHWNGSGSPRFARQLVHLGAQRVPQLIVVPDSGGDRAELRRLVFAWRCPGKRSVGFLPLAPQPMPDRATYALAKPSVCEYGYLVIAGKPNSLAGPLGIELRSVGMMDGSGAMPR